MDNIDQYVEDISDEGNITPSVEPKMVSDSKSNRIRFEVHLEFEFEFELGFDFEMKKENLSKCLNP